MDEKKKKMRRMATWTIIVFAAVFAIFMAVFWLAYFPLTPGSPLHVLRQALANGWPIFLATAVLCFVAYFGYRFYLNRQK
jgi:succinate dehydrogenase hydrophobic anchor subunit